MEPFLGFGNGIFDDFCCQRLMDTVETTVLHRLDRPDLMSRVEDVWLGNLSTIFNNHRAGLGENVEAENGPLKKEHPWNIHGKSGVNVNKMCISLLVLFVGTFHINMVLSCCCEKPPHQVSLGLRSHWWIDQEVGFHLDGLDLDATHQAIRGWAGRIVLEKLNPWWNFQCHFSGVKGWWSDNHNYGKTRHKRWGNK